MMEDLKEVKKLEKSVLEVFDKSHHPGDENSQAEALELLSQLPNPAKVRDDDEDQFTLLHHACYNGWYEVAKVLIEKYNCDPNCRNAAGSIPLRLACWSGNLGLVKYLFLDKGYDPNDKNSTGQVPLHNAASGGHLDVVKFLIEGCKVNPQSRDSGCWTPLHCACASGHISVAKYLVEILEQDPACKDKNNQTPLHSACLRGHLHIAKYLIEKQYIDPSIKDKDGWTPLHFACLKGHLDAAKYLIEEKLCDPACSDNNGWTPLHFACEGGYLNVVIYLTEEQTCSPASKTEEGRTSLHSACLMGHLHLAKYLIEKHKCDPVSKMNDGHTPLHLACLEGHMDVAKYLIEEMICYPSCSNNSGWTPLHCACQEGYLNLVTYLIEEQACNPVCKTQNNLTPLHSACLMGHLHVAKYIIEKHKCDPACRKDDSQTPLHLACERGHLNVAKYLIETQHIDPSAKSVDGQTPLHLACLEGHVDVAKYLIEEKQCDPACSDISGWTPLHSACEGGYLNVVTYLVEEQTCSPAGKNQESQTPLHSACLMGHVHLAKYFIEKHKCDPACKMDDGQTPLHFACERGHLNVAKYLIEEKQCDPICSDNNGWTPLHFACEGGCLNVVIYLTQYLIKNFNPHARDSNGFAPLHIACGNGYLEIVKFLVQEVNCDPMCMTSNAWTPLHSASQGGKLGVIKYLIEEQQCDQSCRTLKGTTPLHLACKYHHFDIVVYFVNEYIGAEILSLPYYGDTLMEETLKGGSDDILFFLMSQGLQFASKYDQIDSHTRLVQPALKIFVLGNAMSGKSTLVKALMSNLAEGGWFKRVFNPKVTGVEPHTAGIIPYHAHSQNCGRLILYDFAGQYEHYSSSHAAILEKLRCAESDLVFIVVDISRPKEKLVKELKYWDSFVLNQYKQEKPPVIVIGSHYDVAKQQGKETLSQALSELPHLNVSITLDCTRKSSSGLTEISNQISAHSKNHHESFNVSAQLHFLNRLLQNKFEDEIACQLYKVFDLIGHEDNATLRMSSLLPLTMDDLSNQLSKLSEHGEFLYIEDSGDIKQSWIIFKKEILLSKLNGSVFAPKEFESVYKDLSSTGVVASSKIIEAFPQYDHKMLTSFMTTLDFCHEIDKSDLSIICSSDRGDQQILDQEQYYFFPALVSTGKNTESCQAITKMSYKFGWCLCCKRNIFFTSRFLQVLLLQLAFVFALPVASSTNKENTLAVERRKCNIWKNGIHWQNMDGVETIVEVIEQNTAVVLIMGCLEGSQIKCIQQRSAVIEAILSAKEKYSAAVDAEESFLHPDELGSYPLREVHSLFTFPLDGLKVAIKERREALTNKVGQRQEMIIIGILLLFEPYTCLTGEIISNLMEGIDQGKIFEDSNDDFFRDCAKVAHPKIELLKKILLLPEHDSEYNTAINERTDQFSDDPTHKCFHVFKTWQKFTSNPTY